MGKWNEKNILADFWARFEIVYGKGFKEEEPTDDDFDNENENLRKNVTHHRLKVRKYSI